jgi:hypothetical protein
MIPKQKPTLLQSTKVGVLNKKSSITTMSKKGSTKSRSTSQANPVAQVYKMVMDDVIENIKEDFANEGVDESVLEELRQVRF